LFIVQVEIHGITPLDEIEIDCARQTVSGMAFEDFTRHIGSARLRTKSRRFTGRSPALAPRRKCRKDSAVRSDNLCARNWLDYTHCRIN